MDKFLDLLRYPIEIETNYSTYHLLWLLLYVLLIYYLLKFYRHMDDKHFRIMLFIVGVFYLIGEVLKLLIIWHHDGTWDIIYYYIPWQFCSTPIYFMWIAALIKNKQIYQGFLTFLVFYCIIGGGVTILNPASVFTNVVFNTIHTMLLHGGMVVIAIYIIGSNRLDLTFKSFLTSMIIFVGSVLIAIGLNILFNHLHPGTVDFFFINHKNIFGPPIVKKVRNFLPYPIYLISYIVIFSALAFGLFSLERLRQKLIYKKTSEAEELASDAA